MGKNKRSIAVEIAKIKNILDTKLFVFFSFRVQNRVASDNVRSIRYTSTKNIKQRPYTIMFPDLITVRATPILLVNACSVFVMIFIRRAPSIGKSV